MERIRKLPEQKNTKKIDSLITAPSEPSASEKVNRKYPYLTAFIGFYTLYMLSGALTIIIPLPPILKLPIQVIAGFYVFKFVIEKNMLPYVQRK